MKEKSYSSTIAACFVGYMVQAVVGLFLPLLFLRFKDEFGIGFDQLSVLVIINFVVQMTVDVLGAKYADRIGWRVCLVLAHVFSAAGIAGISFFPDIMGDPYTGLVVSVVLFAIGGGLIEVMISPVVEACPTKNKAGVMSLLHSFFCWGYVMVVLVSTVYFSIFGIENWRTLALIWAILPAANGIAFCFVPLKRFDKEEVGGEAGISTLVRSGVFWLMVILMMCAGACEQGMSQWSSAFAESALGLSKTAGDLLGPLSFAVLMGISRVIYSRVSETLDLRKAMMVCGCLCLISYVLAAFTSLSVFGLIGCALCGFSIGILWPGTLSMSTQIIPRGGTAMFALLALGGDIGCLAGPALVGFVSGAASDNLKVGLAAAMIFPVLLLIGLWVTPKKNAGVVGAPVAADAAANLKE